MAELPPPDPNESLNGPADGPRLSAPAVVYLRGTPAPETERLANAILDARPGSLIVAVP